MQAYMYLGTMVCKFGGDPVIACQGAGNYSADRRIQTDTTYQWRSQDFVLRGPANRIETPSG